MSTQIRATSVIKLATERSSLTLSFVKGQSLVDVIRLLAPLCTPEELGRIQTQVGSILVNKLDKSTNT